MVSNDCVQKQQMHMIKFITLSNLEEEKTKIHALRLSKNAYSALCVEEEQLKILAFFFFFFSVQASETLSLRLMLELSEVHLHP